MTEIRHLRCDRCDIDIILNSRDRLPEHGWVYCMAGLDRYDFCPSCWKETMAFVNAHGVKD